MIVRLFANKHLEEVAGLVLVDSTHEDQYTKMAPYLSEEIRDYYINKFKDDISWEQLQRTRRSYGDMPLTVLSAGLKDFVHTDKSQEIWLELHKTFLNLSTKSKHIIAEKSTHEIVFNPNW